MSIAGVCFFPLNCAGVSANYSRLLPKSFSAIRQNAKFNNRLLVKKRNNKSKLFSVGTEKRKFVFFSFNNILISFNWFAEVVFFFLRPTQNHNQFTCGTRRCARVYTFIVNTILFSTVWTERDAIGRRSMKNGSKLNK